MPFRRSYGRRSRRPMRRRRFTRRRRRPMTAGRVKRIVDAELKLHDNNLSEISAPSVTGLILHLSGIVIGDSNEERTGNWIKPQTLMGTLSVQGDNNAADLLVQYRVCIVMWKENQDTDPLLLAKLMQNTLQPFQQFNVDSKGAFKILWSRTGNIINEKQNSQFVKYHRFYVKPRMKILYSDDDFRKYHLFFVAYSNIASGNNPPAISITTRLRYTDS